MKYQKWNDLLISSSQIHGIMAYPKGCTPLTPKQTAELAKIKEKEGELTPKEIQTMEVLKAKQDRFNDPELSETAKNYLICRYSWLKYNRGRLSFLEDTHQQKKGKILEPEAIDIISKRDCIDYTIPKEFKRNDYIFGICDCYSLENNKLVDIKSSWDIFNFLKTYRKGLSKQYWMQMQAYLDLYDIDNGEVCFVLMNTPPELLVRAKSELELKYKTGSIIYEEYDEELDRLNLCYDYSKIPGKRKIISFVVNRDREFIKMLYKKVEKCREWMSEFDKIHVNNKKIITLSETYHKHDSVEEDNT